MEVGGITRQTAKNALTRTVVELELYSSDFAPNHKVLADLIA